MIDHPQTISLIMKTFVLMPIIKHELCSTKIEKSFTNTYDGWCLKSVPLFEVEVFVIMVRLIVYIDLHYSRREKLKVFERKTVN